MLEKGWKELKSSWISHSDWDVGEFYRQSEDLRGIVSLEDDNKGKKSEVTGGAAPLPGGFKAAGCQRVQRWESGYNIKQPRRCCEVTLLFWLWEASRGRTKPGRGGGVLG